MCENLTQIVKLSLKIAGFNKGFYKLQKSSAEGSVPCTH
jgi:hypothetical protein